MRYMVFKRMKKITHSWIPWFLATLFYTFQYIIRVLPNVGMDHITSHFEIGSAQIGMFAAVYYIGYTLLHIPLSLFIDRFSVKNVLPTCSVIAALGLLPLIYSENFIYAVLGRFMIGAASSGAILGIFKVVKNGFSAERFTSMIGMSATIGLLGAIYGGRPIDYMIYTYGWETIIKFFVVFGLCFSAVLYVSLPSKVEHGKYHFVLKEMVCDVQKIFCNRRFLLLSLIGGLMVGPIEGFADTWGTLFFQSHFGLDRGHASTLPSFIFIGMCVGSTTIGYLTAKIQKHLIIIASCAICMLVIFAILFAIPLYLDLNILYTLMFLAGVASAYQIVLLGKVRFFISDKLADLSSATCNMIMMIFGTIFHTIIGLVTQHYNSVFIGLGIIPIALLISTLMLVFLSSKKFFNN